VSREFRLSYYLPQRQIETSVVLGMEVGREESKKDEKELR